MTLTLGNVSINTGDDTNNIKGDNNVVCCTNTCGDDDVASIDVVRYGALWLWGLKSTILSRGIITDLVEPLLGCSVYKCISSTTHPYLGNTDVISCTNRCRSCYW